MAISFIQGAAPAYTLSSPASAAFGSNVTKGDLLIVCGNAYNGSATSSTPSDSQGNVYTLIGSQFAPTQFSGTATGYMWYAVAKATGANTVSVTFNANAYALSILEYSGANTLDQSSVILGDGTLSLASNPITTTQANELLICNFFTDDGTTAVTGGFSARLHTTSSLNTLVADEIVSSENTYTATGTATTISGFILILASFYAASSGGGVGNNTDDTGAITSGQVMASGPSFATQANSPRTSIIGTNLGTKFLH
jgi:hypothetical protein